MEMRKLINIITESVDDTKLQPPSKQFERTLGLDGGRTDGKTARLVEKYATKSAEFDEEVYSILSNGLAKDKNGELADDSVNYLELLADAVMMKSAVDFEADANNSISGANRNENYYLVDCGSNAALLFLSVPSPTPYGWIIGNSVKAKQWLKNFTSAYHKTHPIKNNSPK